MLHAIRKRGCIRNWRTSGGAAAAEPREARCVGGVGLRNQRRVWNGFLPPGLCSITMPACAGEFQPNPDDPCGCPICVPKPDAGLRKTLEPGQPDLPRLNAPLRSTPRPVLLGTRCSSALRLRRLRAGGAVEPATLETGTRR